MIHTYNHAINFRIFGADKAIIFELFVQMKAYCLRFAGIMGDRLSSDNVTRVNLIAVTSSHLMSFHSCLTRL